MDILDVQGEQAGQSKGGPGAFEVGVVTSLTPLMANCSGSDEMVTAMIGYTPALGDAALMARARGITVLIGNVATGQSAPSAPAVETSGSQLFPAAYSFSWRDGSPFDFTTSVRQGALDSSGQWSGAWFYQGSIGAELAGATVTGCAVKLTRISGGTPGSQPAAVYQSSTGTWPTPDQEVPPAPVGSVVQQSLSNGESQWLTLPTALGQALVDSDAGLMIFNDSPMVLLSGVDADPESGLIRIDWTR